MTSALSAQHVAKRYGAKEALAGIDLEIASGDVVGLIGPNGAGKSTLVKIACGLVHRSAGAVTVCGAPAGSTDARARLGYLAELFRFPGWATADEVLKLHQQLAVSDGGPSERGELLELVGLAEARLVRVREMSKGMQQRLGIAQALVGSPRLLLLDEPTSALDPAGRRIVRDLLFELRGRGTAVLMNSHLLSEVEQACDRIVVLLAGRIVASGPPEEIVQPAGVEVETGTGVRSFPGVSREEVPGIVADLVGKGERVYGVRVLNGSLEDAYLDLVGRQAT